MQISIEIPYAIHELGCRDNQEDSIYPQEGNASESDRLFLVCDGMGGHANSEVASQLVCDVVSEHLRPAQWNESVLPDSLIQRALVAVQEKLNTFDNGSMRQMGTTFTLLCLHRGGATMAHIGDSRIYHIRPKERRILYKSRDHSLVYDLFLSGEITKEQMATFDRKNVITKAIMPGNERQFKPDIVHTTDILPGDIFYLCSDGMLEQMDDASLVEFFSSGKSDAERRRALIDATADNQDNHSAWIVRIAGVVREAFDKDQPNNEATSKNNAALIEYGDTATFPSTSWWERWFGKLIN